MNIAPKTAAAVGAGSVSIALVEITAWILGYWNITVPPGVGASFATVFSGIASYFAPHTQLSNQEITDIRSEPTPPTPEIAENWNTQK